MFKPIWEESVLANKNRKSSGGRIALTVLCVLLALILVVLITAVVAVEVVLNRIPRFQDQELTLSQEEIEAILNEKEPLPSEIPDETVPEIIWAEAPTEQIGEQEEIVNILLIGQDRRDGESRSRSDAMILCTFNKEANTITFTSFLRDLYVQIPGYMDNRLNVAYPLGGMELLNEALEVNFGVHVDANVEVDFTEFQQVVNRLGGVDVYLTGAEADYLSAYGVSEGMNHLNGEEALAYSRIRYLDSDFGRTNRQRNVLTAMLESCRSLSLGELLALAYDLLPMVTTDLTNTEIIRYATDLFPMLAGCTINTQSVPTSGMYYGTYIREMAVLVPDLEAIREMLKETLQ